MTTNSKTLVNNLKRELKKQGMSYADLAVKLGTAESTIKKMLAKGSFSLARLDEICDVLNVELLELVENINDEVTRISKLTPSQEQAMIDDPMLLLMGYATINFWTLEDFVHRYRIDVDVAIEKLKQLEKFGLLELRSNNRIRPLVSNSFEWLPDGPIAEYMKNVMLPDFFNDDFKGSGSLLLIKNRTLTEESKKILNRKSLELADLFEELAYKDRHYLAGNRDRKGTSLVVAYRSWTISGWSQFAREETN